MNFKGHSELRGKHAFLSPSTWRWINYDDEALANRWNAKMAIDRGTKLHELAEMCINMGQKLPKSDKTLNRYVNDAIRYHMHAEQPLYYSDNCFGTADSICFRDGLLRIHDLKTGVTPAHIEQLIVYAALFCLEYHERPGDIKIELRIYQSDEVNGLVAEADDILPVMDKIIRFDDMINKMREDEML